MGSKWYLQLIKYYMLASTGNDQVILNDAPKSYTERRLPGFYKWKGVIFNKDYVVGIEMEDMLYKYTSGIEDIKAAEEIFNKQYNGVQDTNVGTKLFFSCWVHTPQPKSSSSSSP
jgi:hypothetical protein